MAILVINRSESRCSECQGSSVPWVGVTAHTESLGGYSGEPVQPCGQEYTAVSSDYMGAEVEAHIRSLRPDLLWVSAEDRLSGSLRTRRTGRGEQVAL